MNTNPMVSANTTITWLTLLTNIKLNKYNQIIADTNIDINDIIYLQWGDSLLNTWLQEVGIQLCDRIKIIQEIKRVYAQCSSSSSSNKDNDDTDTITDEDRLLKRKELTFSDYFYGNKGIGCPNIISTVLMIATFSYVQSKPYGSKQKQTQASISSLNAIALISALLIGPVSSILIGGILLLLHLTSISAPFSDSNFYISDPINNNNIFISFSTLY